MKILLIDGNSILNRAFYGLPDLTNSEGLHTNAVIGFINIMLKAIEEEQATHICVAFDLKAPTFRHKMYSEYKGTRKPAPEEFREQIPLIKEVLSSMKIKWITQEGYEADDIIGTLSRIAYNAGYEVTIISGDRDLLQLATDKILVRIPKTKAGKTVIENYYADDVKAYYGVMPEPFIDMKGLMGDSSDNIPGVPGIGEKTAAKLIIEYGSIEKLYENIDSVKNGRIKDNLVNYREQAFFSKILATIKLDCELDFNIEDSGFENPFNEQSYELFQRLEFKSLLNRFNLNDMKKKQSFTFTTKMIETKVQYTDMLEKLQKSDRLGFHFVGDKEAPIGVTLSFSEDIIYIIKFTDELMFKAICEDIKNISSSGIKLCCMDLKYELLYLYFDETAQLFDCQIAAYLINPLKGSYEFNELSSEYLCFDIEDKKMLVGKQEINDIAFMMEGIIKYVAYMCYIPYMTADILTKHLTDMEMLGLYYDIEIPCIYTMFDMQNAGIKVDRTALKIYGDKLKSRIIELESEIKSFAGRDFNINSTKQLGEVLFEELGLKSGKKTKTGYSTSVEVLEKLSGEHEIIPLILEYRQLTKLNSTYVEGLSSYISDDSRIHGTFNQTVTATGRISSTEPNLQNIPTRYPLGREIRKVFIPDDGYVFLDADYSQIELRVLAHFSNDDALINAYKTDEDIHAITAAEVFCVPLSEVDNTLRRRAKAVNFGIVYGISSFGLGQGLDISRKEAEGYIQKYFDTYSGVKTFLDDAVSHAKEKGYSITLFNRRRPLPEMKSSNFITRSFGERAAMNSPIQGTAADIIKIAMILVDRELKVKKLNSRLILQIHDELMIETKKEELEEVKDILKRNMVAAAKLRVPLVVDMNSGNSWYEVK